MKITNTKLFALILLSSAPQLFSMQGTLDTSFNQTGTPPGTVVTATGFGVSQINSIAMQSNGQIVVGGFAVNLGSPANFALARYNTNGTLDTNFGTNGIATFQPGAGTNELTSIAIQSNGQIVAGGYISEQFALVRYNTNGTLDTSFGTNGIVITLISGSIQSNINSIAIQPNGQIVAAGFAIIGANEFALARYNTNGTLDTSFGTNGVVTTSISGSNFSQINSITMQSNGQIVAGGYATQIVSGINEFALARYNPNGALDTSFGTNGVVTTSISGSTNNQINSVLIQSNGQIVAGGSTIINGASEFVLARYNSNGTLDSSFDTNGIVITSINGSTSSGIFSIAMQSDGQIIAAGGSSGELALTRYNTNGSLDTSFGTDGIVTTAISGFTSSQINSISIQSNGQIVAAGYVESGSFPFFNYDFALARYNANTSLTQSPLTLALKNKYYSNGTGAKQGPVF